MAPLRTIRDIDPQGKRILLRVDFNVPIDEQGNITDDARIRKEVPTMQYLIERGAQLIIISHLGRPKGKPVEILRLDKVAQRVSELLNRPVKKIDECVGDIAKQTVGAMQNGDIVMLENVRFYPEEEANDDVFAKKLAGQCDIFVNDGFGVSHRPHASIYGIGSRLTAYAGFLIEKEIAAMQPILEHPEKPFVLIIGGAKIKDKVGVIEKLSETADHILIGGGPANVFFAAQGKEIGQSLCDKDWIEMAQGLLAKTAPGQIVLPCDVVTARETSDTATTEIHESTNIPSDTKILDIGPKTIEQFTNIIKTAKTILWNGPQGLTEYAPFQNGTRAVAQAIVESKAFSVIGGGDTGEVLDSLGFSENQFSHVSTGGGASLEFLSGKELPGIKILYSDYTPSAS